MQLKLTQEEKACLIDALLNAKDVLMKHYPVEAAHITKQLIKAKDVKGITKIDTFGTCEMFEALRHILDYYDMQGGHDIKDDAYWRVRWKIDRLLKPVPHLAGLTAAAIISGGFALYAVVTCWGGGIAYTIGLTLLGIAGLFMLTVPTFFSLRYIITEERNRRTGPKDMLSYIAETLSCGEMVHEDIMMQFLILENEARSKGCDDLE